MTQSHNSSIPRSLNGPGDHHKIQKWVANGWLRDRVQGTHRHDGNDREIHRFREKDILAFTSSNIRRRSISGKSSRCDS